MVAQHFLVWAAPAMIAPLGPGWVSYVKSGFLARKNALAFKLWMNQHTTASLLQDLNSVVGGCAKVNHLGRSVLAVVSDLNLRRSIRVF